MAVLATGGAVREERVVAERVGGVGRGGRVRTAIASMSEE